MGKLIFLDIHTREYALAGNYHAMTLSNRNQGYFKLSKLIFKNQLLEKPLKVFWCVYAGRKAMRSNKV